MEAFIKGFLGVFIFAMITYLCAGVISAEIDSSQARNYMDNAKQSIAESNFSSDAIEEAGTKAAENGYEMKITVYERGKGKQTFSYGESGNASVGDTSKVNCVEMVMKYPYSIPILGVKNEHTVRGYVN
ncbi:MAG: hypothetical protein ACI4C5_08200 [Lachnospiraceae bacterium]